MIKAVGITAEYNPLHNGHIYHISQAREACWCDAVVVAMSGNFVQRGEMAVFDKWTRARHALACGADLVIEIPVLYCLADAGQYAAASVRLLESLGCVSHIAFGSECGDADAIARTADFLSVNRDRLHDELNALSRSGMSYPAARESACIKLGADDDIIRVLRHPNDILATEYVRNMRSSVPVAIRRAGAGYGDAIDNSVMYQSASGIRDAIHNGLDVSAYVPDCVRTDIASMHSNSASSCMSEKSASRLFDLVRYALLSSDTAMLDDCPSGGEGLGNIIRDAAGRSESLGELIMATKSRRYTYTRISRLLMQALIGIYRSEYYTLNQNGEYAAYEPGYIRILGFNEKGRRLLSSVRRDKSASLPLITNINKERQHLNDISHKLLDLDVHAGDMYSLAAGGSIYADSDYRRMPVISGK